MSQKAMKQEFFEIKDSSLLRKKIVRQDRYEVPQGKAFLKIKDHKIEILNVNAFGFALISTEQQTSWLTSQSEIIDADLFFYDSIFQTINFRTVRKEKHPSSVHQDWILGCEIIGEPLDVERLKAVQSTLEVVHKQQLYTKELFEVPIKFRSLVLEMKSWLENLRSHVTELNEKVPFDNSRDEGSFKGAIVDTIGAYLTQVIPPMYSQIPEILKDCSKEERQIATEFARKQLGPIIYGAPFANRAYFKPRGYAGDYEMMNHLYRNEGSGKSLFDQCLQRYFIDEPAGQAVKNRGYYLLSKILEMKKISPDSKVFKIVSVASGPAMEVQLFLEKKEFPKDTHFEFHFIDQDEESLKHAQRQIHSIERFVKSNYSFNFHNLAIKNIIAKGIPFNDCDLVYSAGLFDYFTDPVATAAASRFLEACNSKGRAIIGNFSKDNPSTLIMEYFLDWYLIYRSPEDLKRIFSPAGSVVDIEKEQLGINLFAILKK